MELISSLQRLVGAEVSHHDTNSITIASSCHTLVPLCMAFRQLLIFLSYVTTASCISSSLITNDLEGPSETSHSFCMCAFYLITMLGRMAILLEKMCIKCYLCLINEPASWGGHKEQKIPVTLNTKQPALVLVGINSVIEIMSDSPNLIFCSVIAFCD